jgi:hypothetical protein
MSSGHSLSTTALVINFGAQFRGATAMFTLRGVAAVPLGGFG